MTVRMRAAGIFLLALTLGACGTVRPAAKPVPKPKPTSSWVLYTNRKVGVSLGHPQGWKPVKGYLWRIGGADGFLQLLALNGADWTAQQAAQNQAAQQLHPFGTNPTIEPLTAGGQAGYLIMPSKDANQPTGASVAELVLPYPTVETIDGVQYHFFILDATASLIQRIAATVHFVQ